LSNNLGRQARNSNITLQLEQAAQLKTKNLKLKTYIIRMIGLRALPALDVFVLITATISGARLWRVRWMVCYAKLAYCLATITLSF
jgi:hypothetical protein